MGKRIKIKKTAKKKDSIPKAVAQDFPTLKINSERDIAMDFAVKVYERFNKTIKSIALFGSAAKNESTAESDIDIIIIIDDITIKWDLELVAWYREELEKVLKKNPYKKNLHINTIKLSTWWEDLMRGDPVIINVLRFGEELVDMGGFFSPLKYLLLQGKIRSTPESIYANLQRAPMHLARSRAAEMSAVEGLFWAMVDSSHAALIAINILPPSPEHLHDYLKINFVDKNFLNKKYADWFIELFSLHKRISHGKMLHLNGADLEKWQQRTEEFIHVMAELVEKMIDR